jgi:hypothetical protein
MDLAAGCLVTRPKGAACCRLLSLLDRNSREGDIVGLESGMIGMIQVLDHPS